jgi:hypothetical protein
MGFLPAVWVTPRPVFFLATDITCFATVAALDGGSPFAPVFLVYK